MAVTPVINSIKGQCLRLRYGDFCPVGRVWVCSQEAWVAVSLLIPVTSCEAAGSLLTHSGVLVLIFKTRIIMCPSPVVVRVEGGSE